MRFSRSLPSSSTRQLVRSQSNLSDHQKKMMARGLPKQKKLPNVNKVICVASGKGGVGKSTVSVNLAIALANKFKLRTGLLDADIYGPSIPRMMNLARHQPEIDKATNQMLPLKSYNVDCMSMGFLVEEETAIVWRGLMVMNAIERLLFKVNWPQLDVLVIDMPPGTGDVQLSISQNLKVDGSVIVSTPQDIALLDARRAVDMFKKVNVDILGLVQNMSLFRCSKCGHVDHIFGDNGTKRLAESVGADFLGDVELNPTIRACADSGQPLLFDASNNSTSQLNSSYFQICEKIIQKLQL